MVSSGTNETPYEPRYLFALAQEYFEYIFFYYIK